ncbi:MAG TPA: transcription termination/antitermination NusG family protein [Chloroflexota bacterium]|nr:transcription termination/antitermination NusG family protein [Chloroflexota bacterium]HUM72233.1 transcription termination/antitermination NusG family protein [Chloroflexota bacterium]
MTIHWYALRVKPHKERTVYELLQARQETAFFPTLHVRPVNPRAARVRPYFPGYLFVQANLDEAGINVFSWLPGTRGLVTFGDMPAVVPDNLIGELRQRLRQIEADGGLPYGRYHRGDRVRIISGPFAGYDAIFDTHLPGAQRVQVLLAFLSHYPQPVKLNIDYISRLN